MSGFLQQCLRVLGLVQVLTLGQSSTGSTEMRRGRVRVLGQHVGRESVAAIGAVATNFSAPFLSKSAVRHTPHLGGRSPSSPREVGRGGHVKSVAGGPRISSSQAREVGRSNLYTPITSSCTGRLGSVGIGDNPSAGTWATARRGIQELRTRSPRVASAISSAKGDFSRVCRLPHPTHQGERLRVPGTRFCGIVGYSEKRESFRPDTGGGLWASVSPRSSAVRRAVG